MNNTALTLEQVKAMFLQVSRKMIAKKDELTKADQAIGDGDHGIGMSRGFEAVEKKLSDTEFESIPKLLNGVGMTMMMTMGGSSGAIFGTLFKGGSKNMNTEGDFTSQSLSQLLSDGLNGIKQRGGAKIGDKTMVDALEPAAATARECAASELPVAEALQKAAMSAHQGMENTKNLIATMGRAKTLGDRCLGHADPGAISMAYILKFMTEYIEQN